jgi:hypothetical protein
MTWRKNPFVLGASNDCNRKKERDMRIGYGVILKGGDRIMKFNDDVKAIVASILALGVATREKSESEIIEIFKRIYSEMDKVEKDFRKAL